VTLVHFLVDLCVAGLLTALLARAVELADRGSSDEGPSDGGSGGGGGWWRRPAPPAPRPHPTGARDRRNLPNTRPHDRPRPVRVRTRVH
jgi:hypothetical protein